MVRVADAVGGLPRAFIASSSFGLLVARALSRSISRQLKRRFEPQVWDKVFELSQTNIENLEREVRAADFAIAVLTADDKRVRAGEERPRAIPRDNVILEIGLFMGRLGRKRCLLVQEDRFDLELPSDLAGLATAHFTYDAQGLSRALLDAGKLIAERIRASPVRTDKAGLSPEASLQVTQTFCRRIAGFWWSVRAWDRASTGLVEISGDAHLGTLHVSGNAYRASGNVFRSLTAEYALRRALGSRSDVLVASAGTEDFPYVVRPMGYSRLVLQSAAGSRSLTPSTPASTRSGTASPFPGR